MNPPLGVPIYSPDYRRNWSYQLRQGVQPRQAVLGELYLSQRSLATCIRLNYIFLVKNIRVVSYNSLN